MKRIHALAGATVLIAAGSAAASSVTIDGIGGSVTMNAAPLASTVFGGASSGSFTNESLESVHLHLNDNGIVTNDLVTFVLAEVDTTGDSLADALGFLVLVDNEVENGSFVGLTSSLAMDSDADNDSLAWINDTSDQINVDPTAGGANLNAEGVFEWDAREKGDGFAWSGLTAGDFVTFNFYEDARQAGGVDDFQFVSWNGTGYDVVAEESLSANSGIPQFGFSLTVVPLPAAAWAGLAGLALAGVARRRMVG